MFLFCAGGISKRGKTRLIAFRGTMRENDFQELCEAFLIPFIDENYPHYHRLHMDNAPSHSSYSTKLFLMLRNVIHFKTPAQSPDLNPIELVWNDMKYFIKTEVKPNSIHELIEGVMFFWNNKVTINYCQSKIGHLQRVLKEIIRVTGKATGL